MGIIRFSIVATGLAVVLALSGPFAFSANLDSLNAGRVEIKSAGPMAFGPDAILFVGDSMSASIIALDTGDRTPAKSAVKVNVKAINQKIAALLGATPDHILVNDAVVNPISKNVYLSVSRGLGPDAIPVILRVNASGAITELPLDNIKHSVASLTDAPAVDAKDSRGRGLRVATITDLAYVEGKVFVAGLSNEEFTSSFRSISFPFQEVNKGAGIEIYHGSHGRFETYSPIRTFLPFQLAGEPYILAAYTCTPLVKIPIAALKPGHKVQGVTIAELGNRNRPLDMIAYSKGGQEYFLMANSSRGVMKLAAKGLEKFQAITSEVEDMEGMPYETVANLQGVQQLDKLDENSVLILTDGGGTLDLRTAPLP